MAESAGKQLLSALTEGREKGNKATTKKSSSKSTVKGTAKSGNQGNQRANKPNRKYIHLHNAKLHND